MGAASIVVASDCSDSSFSRGTTRRERRPGAAAVALLIARSGTVRAWLAASRRCCMAVMLAMAMVLDMCSCALGFCPGEEFDFQKTGAISGNPASAFMVVIHLAFNNNIDTPLIV